MKKTIILSLICTAGLMCAPDQKQLGDMTPYALFGLLERAKIAAFSTDSFQKSGADPKGVALWNELIYNCNQLVLHEIKKSDLLKFSRYQYELDQTRLYILETIDALHAKKQPGTSARAQKLLLNMFAIEDECFAEIRKHSKPDSNWIAHIPNNHILTPLHQEILDSYIVMAKRAEEDGHPVSEHELQGLLKLYRVQNKQAVKLLIDNLEQYCYKKEKHYRYARALITDLTALFPDILSSFDLSLLANTKDKPNLIIFAQSGAYENILHQILRELN